MQIKWIKPKPKMDQSNNYIMCLLTNQSCTINQLGQTCPNNPKWPQLAQNSSQTDFLVQPSCRHTVEGAVITDCLCTQGDCRYCRILNTYQLCYVCLMDGCLQQPSFSLGFHSKSSVCVYYRSCVRFVCVLKAKRQSPVIDATCKTKTGPA